MAIRSRKQPRGRHATDTTFLFFKPTSWVNRALRGIQYSGSTTAVVLFGLAAAGFGA